jgi:signal transduction histidine kinase
MITIKLSRDDKFCYIRIKDTGIGIPKEDLPNVFERFYRVDKSRELVEGSGIGLTIVKNFVKLNGGTIDVTSTVGKGSTFTIKFRLYEVGGPSMEIAGRSSELMDEENI